MSLEGGALEKWTVGKVSKMTGIFNYHNITHSYIIISVLMLILCRLCILLLLVALFLQLPHLLFLANIRTSLPSVLSTVVKIFQNVNAAKKKQKTNYSSLSVGSKHYTIVKDNKVWATLKYKHALRKNRKLHNHKDFVPIKKCKVYLENYCSLCTAMQAFWFVVQIPTNN